MLAEKLAKEASKAVDHLADTAALYRAINGSQLPEHLRRKYKDKLSLMQQAFVRSTRFFATMEQAIEQAPQRIVVLLEICGGKAFVEKDLQQRAEDAVVQAVSALQFVPSYLAGSRSPEERTKTLGVLRGKLRDAGFDPDTMLKTD